MKLPGVTMGLVAAVLLGTPTGLTGQLASIVEGDRLYQQLRGEESLRVFEGVVAREPQNFEALWRAARGALVLGEVEKRDLVARDVLYKKAREYAARAIAVDSLRIDGHYWLVSVKGREALHASFSTAARLVGEVYDEAHGVLARDSLYAGAHYVLGALNYEVMKLPRIKRWLGRKVLGNRGLQNTSWENARRYLERAVELDPEMILFRYDLARFYETRGEYEAAQAEFGRLVALKRKHPMDQRLQVTSKQRLSALIERAATHDGGR